MMESILNEVVGRIEINSTKGLEQNGKLLLKREDRTQTSTMKSLGILIWQKWRSIYERCVQYCVCSFEFNSIAC